ncbi:MAG: hypothetical protein ACE5D7_07200, partial [Fidelibacterota bacterium]
MISCQSFLISLITSLSFVFTESISNEYNFQDNSTDMTSRELIHDDDVTKIFNDYEITRDMVVTGDLKIVGGMLVVNGTVNGEIQVLGGDIEINESAIVNGTIIAIGGTIRKSPLATIKGEILELNKDKFSISRIPDDETGAEFSDWFKEDNCCSNCCVNDIKRPHSKPYSDDDWMRYNRAEGFYLQLNFHVENEFIPGNTFYG